MQKEFSSVLDANNYIEWSALQEKLCMQLSQVNM